MVPELAHLYGLSPRDVWEMTPAELEHFIEHRRALYAAREAANG